MNIKKLIGAALALPIAVGGLVAANAPHADAYTTPGCITRPEWKLIHQGQTRTRVHTLTGAWGSYAGDEYSLPGWKQYNYRPCRPYNEWSILTIAYQRDWNHVYRVDVAPFGKTAIWVHN